MKVTPLYLPKPESFWDKVHYAIDRDGTYAHRFLLRQLAERVENNIKLEDYWTDEDSLTIVKITMEAIYKVSRVKALLLPNDLLDFWCTMFGDDMETAEILCEVETRCHCSVSEEDFGKCKTFGDLVAFWKSSADSPVQVSEMKRAHWLWGWLWGAVLIIIFFGPLLFVLIRGILRIFLTTNH